MEAESRDEVLSVLTGMVEAAGKLEDQNTFYQAIINREKIVTTGIEMGVAIPHAKLPSLSQFFIAIALLKKGVDWKALDAAPVRLIFMIGGPDNKQNEYLQILSTLTSVIRDEERRKNILMASDPQALFELFREF
jgi:PTS system nitrogen regulatory IIA component